MYKVLVIDDEYAICEGLQILIEWENYGFDVPEFALDGIEAIEKMKSVKYDVIISDIRMPGIDGIEFIRKVREDRNPVKIIVLSWYKDFEYARIALENRVKNYILKPVNEQILIKALVNIKLEMEEELIKKITVNQSAAIIKENVLQNLIKPDDRNLRAYLSAKKLGLHLEGYGLTVCIVEMDENNEDGLQNDHGKDWTAIKSIIKEALENEDLGYVFEIEMERLGILACRIQENTLPIAVFLNKLLDNVHSIINTSITIAAGSECFSYESLPESYSNACKTLESRVFMGNNRVITFEEVSRLDVPAKSTIRLAIAVKKYIKEHCTEEINLKSVSKVFYMNPAYLGRVFKNTFCITFTDYVNDCKIEYAVKLLEKGDLKIHEVSSLVGYKDINYFYEQFKSRKSMAPSEFRRQHPNNSAKYN